MRASLSVSLCLALLFALAGAVQATQYQMVDLGLGVAHAVNNVGQVVGETYLSDGTHGFLWQNGTMVDLGKLAGCTSCFASGINDSGQVAGDCYNPSTGSTQAFVWRNGVMTDLGTLPGGIKTFCSGINSSGQVVGYAVVRQGSYLYNHAFVWKNGVMTDLGPDSMAYGINTSGQVVGYSTVSSHEHACLWQDGEMTDLGTLPDARFSSDACAINDSGQSVGWSDTPSGNYAHAFRYANGTMTDLGTLPGAGGSIAYGINSSGQVVGASGGHAFLLDGTMIDLGTLPGADTSSATGISDQSWICGYAKSGTVFRAVLWQPVPEPSSVLALLCGIIGVGGVIGRRGSRLRQPATHDASRR